MKLANGLLGLFAMGIGSYWLAHPGFLFLLDYVTGPTLQPIHIDNTGLVSGIPIQLLAHMLAAFVPAEAITKILISVALLVAGISTAHVSSRITHSNSIAFSCGIFAMLNPFVFNRIFMGHMYLLFGYSLMPVLLLLILRYIQLPSSTRALWIGGISAGIILVSIHYSILMPIAVLFFILQYRKNQLQKIPRLHCGLIFIPPIGICVILAIFALSTPTWAGHTLKNINSSVFALRPYCSTSLTWDTFTLSASWKTPISGTYPCNATSLFMVASAILILCAALGLRSIWIFLLYVISILLALGIPHLPWWTGMRDSGKFLGNAILAQTMLFANATTNIRRRPLRFFYISLLLACSLVIATSTLSALLKTITPSIYPNIWYEWNTKFKNEDPRPRVLFLPWHQYVAFDFTNNLAVANPAPIFFTNAEIISGDNIEILSEHISVQSISKNPVSKDIERVLETGNDTEFTSRLQELVSQKNISYIMLAQSNENTDALRHRLTSALFLKQQLSDEKLDVWKVVQK